MEIYNLRGKISEIWETKTVSAKFRKREFVMEHSNSSERGTYIDHIKMQLINNNCELLEGVSKGDQVLVKWTLMGRKWKKENENVYFTNVECKDITVTSRADGTGAEDTIEDQFPIEPEPEKYPATPDNSIPDPNEEIDDLPF